MDPQSGEPRTLIKRNGSALINEERYRLPLSSQRRVAAVPMVERDGFMHLYL